MLVPSIRISFATLAFTALAAVAASATESATNKLHVVTTKEAMLGRDPITRAYVTSATKKFTFIVPSGFRLDASKGDELILTSADYASCITLRVVGRNGGDAPPTENSFRSLVLNRYSETEIVEEFSLSAAGFSGPAFDVRGKTSEGLTRACRVSFIPCGGQTLEFGVVSASNKFNSATAELQSVMLTFRVGEANAKPEVAVLSEKL